MIVERDSLCVSGTRRPGTAAGVTDSAAGARNGRRRHNAAGSAATPCVQVRSVTPAPTDRASLNETTGAPMSTVTPPLPTTFAATMTVRQTSKLLGISLRATYRAIEAGQIPVIRIGRRIYVLTHKLHAMLGIPLDHVVAADRIDDDVHGDVPADGRTSR